MLPQKYTCWLCHKPDIGDAFDLKRHLETECPNYHVATVVSSLVLLQADPSS